VVCGFLFVSYEVALYLAIGLSVSSQQVLVVGLLNYLWPALILLMAIPLLGYHASPWLGAGVVLSMAGVSLALGVNPLKGEMKLGEAWLPYLLAFYAAFAWAIYTNLSRRWLRDSVVSGLPAFILLTGLVFAGMRLFVRKDSVWTLQAILSLAYLVVCVTWLAYTFWDIGSRRGNLILLGTLSYFIPLLSTLISALVLRQVPGTAILLATLFLVAGAWICNRAIRPKT
jgi:drug/metabolite transporter (DMT)-like permease